VFDCKLFGFYRAFIVGYSHSLEDYIFMQPYLVGDWIWIGFYYGATYILVFVFFLGGVLEFLVVSDLDRNLNCVLKKSEG